jgi:signal transduction histidine kinase
MGGNAALRWLTRDPLEIDEVRQAIEGIIKDADRANDVIGRIHGLVRKAAPSRDALEINGAILEVVDLTRAEAAKQGVTMQMQLADNLPQIRGDRVQLQQVMINLIINAIQAMGGVEGARELHISTEYNASEVRVAVQDTGLGLSAENLSRLFEPFYTTKPGGMGMGLSISRSIIEDHRGRLWASESDSNGALFQFTLPVRVE